MVAASALLLSSACKAFFFLEINPAPPSFFPLKIPPMERSFDSQR